MPRFGKRARWSDYGSARGTPRVEARRNRIAEVLSRKILDARVYERCKLPWIFADPL
jgi:hypothetical protein